MKRALVIGGTGQTGPLIVGGLLERGFEVAVLHGGQHERSDLPAVEHIHVDPHFEETLAPALAGRAFDLVIATYGRMKVIGDALVGRTGRLIATTGTAYAWLEPNDPRWGPLGVTLADESAPFSQDLDHDRISTRVAQSERALFAHHEAGDFEVTILRYPEVYGPDSLVGWDWSVIRRILDHRRHIIVADGGLAVASRLYRDNAAHALLLVVDQPLSASGHAFNVADDAPMLTRARIIDLFADALDHDWELVDMPSVLAETIYPFWGYHRAVDNKKIATWLGYRDVVPVSDALTATARWWAEHPPERGGAFEQKMGDSFDYATEDALIEAYKSAITDLVKVAGTPAQMAHPWRHPTKPGQAWDASASLKIIGGNTFGKARRAPFVTWSP